MNHRPSLLTRVVDYPAISKQNMKHKNRIEELEDEVEELREELSDARGNTIAAVLVCVVVAIIVSVFAAMLIYNAGIKEAEQRGMIAYDQGLSDGWSYGNVGHSSIDGPTFLCANDNCIPKDPAIDK